MKCVSDKRKPSHGIKPKHGPTGELIFAYNLQTNLIGIIQKSYTKASRAELAEDYDEAFGLYIKAAEGFLYLSRGSVDDASSARWKKEAGKALERAERIKGVKGQSGLRGVEVDFWSDGTCVPLFHAALHPWMSF
jgi:hypothetical protein